MQLRLMLKRLSEHGISIGAERRPAPWAEFTLGFT
jgi:hypothetical protein